MEALILPLIATAMLAIGLVAYRYHATYEKLHAPLCVIGGIALIACGVWNLATISAAETIATLDITVQDQLLIFEVLSGQWFDLMWVGAIFFAYLGFLLLLSFLPRLMKEKKHES